MVEGTYDFPGDMCVFHIGERQILEIQVPVGHQPFFKFQEIIVFGRPLLGELRPVFLSIGFLLPCPHCFAVCHQSTVNRVMLCNIPFIINPVIIPAAKNTTQGKFITVGQPAGLLVK